MAITRRAGGKAPLPSATSLPASAKDDQNKRMRNYLISMGLRTVCFVAAVLLWNFNRWAAGACAVLATVLPYIAVVFANATGKRRIDVLGSVQPSPTPHKEIHGPTAAHHD